MTFLYEKPGTLPKPGLIGRIVRLVVGILWLAIFGSVVDSYEFGMTWNPNNLLLWGGVALAVYYLPRLVSAPFGYSWQRGARLIFALAIAATAVIDFIFYQKLFGPSVTLLIFVLLAYATALAGLSYLLAGIFAAPG